MWKLRSEEWLSAIRCRIADNVGLLLNQRDRLTPPAGLFGVHQRIDGSQSIRDFFLTGQATVGWFINSEGLQPTDRVLDIGCGIGRMAIPLMTYLRDGGKYDGVDIERAKVKYCQRTISRRAPNFRFVHADIYSKYYNPKAMLKAAEYKFPYSDSSFDFVFLESVFTHMLPADMEHYLSEIGRVLSPGGKSICTFYLKEELGPPFHRYSDVCEVLDAAEPEHCVHYIEDYVRACYETHGIVIDQVIHGTKFGRHDVNHSTEQDVLVAKKPVLAHDLQAAVPEQ